MPPSPPIDANVPSDPIAMSPIGVLRCGFPDKFGVPRQPGLVPAATGCIQFHGKWSNPEAVRGLADFSHIWIIFHFHRTRDMPCRATVRPPRLGGNRRVGVFASRSPFRPNGIGQSVVRLLEVGVDAGRVTLTVGGIDLVDGTPILDIKPYLPYIDSVGDARGGYAGDGAPERMAVVFSEAAAAGCRQAAKTHPEFESLIRQVLAIDPRPAYDAVRKPEKEYALGLYEWQIRWRVSADGVAVTGVDRGDTNWEHRPGTGHSNRKSRG